MRIPRAITAWAGDWQSAGARRWAQRVLGLLWLLDAALQFQPYMFTRAFPVQVIESAGAGSPALVASPVMFAGHLMLHSEVTFNALFATIQLALGLGLLCRRSVRAALAGTVVWALSVWWLGEGLGGIFTGAASPVSGTPGGAVLYALIAIVIWPPRRQPAGGASIASGGLLGRSGARLAWLVLWGSGAFLLLLAPNRAAGALRDAIGGGAGGEPGWVAAIDHGAAAAIGTSGSAASVLLAVAFAIIAIGVLIPAAARPVLVLAMLTAAAIWITGEDFGGIFTGQGTDPGNGPLLILLAAAYWPLARARRPSPALPPRPAVAGIRQLAWPAAGQAAGPGQSGSGISRPASAPQALR